MFKKTMLLAAMAVAAAAFAIPAVASAQWTHNTAPIAGNTAITMAGNLSFASAIGGTSCTETTWSGAVSPSTTGFITAFTATGCKGTGGLAGCTVTTVKPDTLPWELHIITTSAVEITTVNITTTFHGVFCPYHELTHYGNLILTPEAGENHHRLHHLNLGNGTGHTLETYNGTTGATVSTIGVTGTLSMTPATTYGLT